jgi:hypothetical protein
MAAATERLITPARYLLFDPVQNEGMSMQRSILSFFLRRAMELGVVLVLPRCRLLARHSSALNHQMARASSGFEYLPWSTLYNKSALAALHPVVEMTADFPGRTPLTFYLWVGAGCDRIQNASAQRRLLLSGFGVRVRSFMCAHDGPDSFPTLYRLTRAADFVALANSNSILPLHGAQQLRPYMRFTDALYAAAAAFIWRVLGGASFLAVHWRRGDFVGLRDSMIVHPASRVVSAVRTLRRRLGVQRVFLASDAPPHDAELQQLQAILQPVRVTRADVTSDLLIVDPKASAGVSRSALARAQLAHLESAVCAMAPFFVGSADSSFSLTILEERLSVFGHAEGTGGEMHGDRLRGMQSQHGRLRLQPLPLPARPPFLRVQPPRTVAEVRSWEIGQRRVQG